MTAEAALILCMSPNHDVKKNEAGHLVGESTELALAAFAQLHVADTPTADYPRTAELPFDPERKMMTTVHQWKAGKFLIITKGAIESLLKICEQPDHAFADKAHQMAKDGLRVLAFGYRVADTLPTEISFSGIEKQLHCIGLAGLTDPPRKGAARAISKCRKAGIVPVMITGDHPETAAAIAREIGILNRPEDEMISGVALGRLSPSEFDTKIECIKVYARVSPAQKLLIVKTLQHKKHFVAMTGDGVNDAPALRRADIGIAMGITGTDVTKAAADMILLNDNFTTILKAVKEGRRVFSNIRKSIKFLLAGNTGEIWTITIALLLGFPIPLLPIHILWINLVTDGLPAMALAAEPAEKSIMARPPRDPRESIFANGLGWHILWVGFMIGVLCFGTQYVAISNNDPKWQTYVFTVLCFCQMSYVMAVRGEHISLFRLGLLSNKPLLFAVLGTIGLQMLVVYVPLLQRIFSTKALSMWEMGGCIAISFTVFIAVETDKLIREKWNGRRKISQPKL